MFLFLPFEFSSSSFWNFPLPSFHISSSFPFKISLWHSTTNIFLFSFSVFFFSFHSLPLIYPIERRCIRFTWSLSLGRLWYQRMRVIRQLMSLIIGIANVGNHCAQNDINRCDNLSLLIATYRSISSPLPPPWPPSTPSSPSPPFPIKNNPSVVVFFLYFCSFSVNVILTEQGITGTRRFCLSVILHAVDIR